MTQTRTCDKPSCTDQGDRTYVGPHGNTLDLCDGHYYDAVVSGNSNGDTPDVDPTPPATSRRITSLPPWRSPDTDDDTVFTGDLDTITMTVSDELDRQLRDIDTR